MIKKLLFTLTLSAAGCFGQTGLNLLNALVHCPATGNYFLISVSGTFQCIPLPSTVTITGTPPVINFGTTNNPLQMDTVSLSSVAANATTFAFTPSKPVANNSVMLYWYNTTNLAVSSSGAFFFVGSPINISLPVNWQPTDTINFVYLTN